MALRYFPKFCDDSLGKLMKYSVLAFRLAIKLTIDAQ